MRMRFPYGLMTETMESSLQQKRADILQFFMEAVLDVEDISSMTEFRDFVGIGAGTGNEYCTVPWLQGNVLSEIHRTKLLSTAEYSQGKVVIIKFSKEIVTSFCQSDNAQIIICCDWITGASNHVGAMQSLVVARDINVKAAMEKVRVSNIDLIHEKDVFH